MLEISFRRTRAVGILDLSGTIDINAANLVEKVGWALENGCRHLICDFEDVELIDYAGLSALALAFKDVLNHAGKMKFVAVPMHIRKTFNLVCLDKVFELHDTIEQALTSFEEDAAISAIKKKKLRRRFKRLPLDIGIEYKGKGESAYHRGKVLNISAVGMLVFAEKTYRLGEILDIKLTLRPAPGVMETEVVVVWLVEKKIQPQIYPGMGLEFYHLDSETQAKVLQFVERNLPLGSAAES